MLSRKLWASQLPTVACSCSLCHLPGMRLPFAWECRKVGVNILLPHFNPPLYLTVLETLAVCPPIQQVLVSSIKHGVTFLSI